MTTPTQPRWMLPTLVALAAVLLAALVAIAVLVASLGSAAAAPAPRPEPAVTASPEPTPTPEATPEPEPTAEPEAAPAPLAPAPAPPAPAPPSPPAPPSNKPTFTSFSPKNGTDVGCADEYDARDVSFSWSVQNADRAWIGISTQNAQAAPFAEVPTTGSYTITFQCSEESEVYTVTAVGSSGTTHYTVRLHR